MDPVRKEESKKCGAFAEACLSQSTLYLATGSLLGGERASGSVRDVIVCTRFDKRLWAAVPVISKCNAWRSS